MYSAYESENKSLESKVSLNLGQSTTSQQNMNMQ